MHTAIVTGGTRGIGYAVAAALLKSGGRVMITGRNQAAVDAAVVSLGETAGALERVSGRAVDVRDAAAVKGLIAQTVQHFGVLDTLINNAGVGAFSRVEDTTDEEWARVIGTNLTGVFNCSRAAIPAIRQAGGGWIINVASLAGRNYFANGAAYCASKAGLVAFTESLMLEVRDDNIRVSVVMPGFHRPVRPARRRVMEAHARRHRARRRRSLASSCPQPAQQGGDSTGADEVGPT
jgi:3-oxoacyl-[acyl-carrier protein] reductase